MTDRPPLIFPPTRVKGLPAPDVVWNPNLYGGIPPDTTTQLRTPVFGNVPYFPRASVPFEQGMNLCLFAPPPVVTVTGGTLPFMGVG